MRTAIRLAVPRPALKMKLLLAAALLILGLFIVYSLVQYFVLQSWMLKVEETSVRKEMLQLQDHFTGRLLTDDPVLLDGQQRFIETVNQNGQRIRLLRPDGSILLSVSDGIPEDWVPQEMAAATRLMHTSHEDNLLIVMRSPVRTGQFTGTIEIVSNLSMFGRLNRLMLVVMLAGGAIAVVVSGLGGWLLAGQLLRPVQRLAEAMRRAEANGLQERVALTDSGDELSWLAKLFNGLMDRVEASFRQQKQFVEDASHELKTPISIIEGHLSLLDRWGKRDPAVLDESLYTSLQQVSRLKGIMRELLDLSRAEAGPPEHVERIELAEALTPAVAGFAAVHPDFRFETELTGLSGVTAVILQQHLEQIVLILLDNAVKYSAHRKEIRLTGAYEEGRAIVRIEDRGIGIAEKDLPYLFDRFYRADKARSRESGGTGLGLSIAKRLAENYGGTVTIASRVGEGTAATVTLPAHLVS
ncbi:HAMP domain-containing histidine kinase [Paenibacillus filicis]|uniref:Signal transduction histidine-protein kinase ArlS n=1 Tax=Paenibacillus gyeongsangnamensis TaxID=3388067 RepID=A0ABT4QA59_9BACL|nr:HAMP domain-containing histidine kinase [Paenibacillus filicis]MCZ8513767.1 HAMP domain-containing histidine kinase [Paenibacillus filicis]